MSSKISKGKIRFKAAASGVSFLMNEMKKPAFRTKWTIAQFAMIRFADEHFNNKQEQLRRSVNSFFTSVDTDNSGEISVVEFMTALRIIGERLGAKFHYRSAMSLFAKLDEDHGGSIDADELYEGVLKARDCQFVEICMAVMLSHQIYSFLNMLAEENEKVDEAARKELAENTNKILSDYGQLQSENADLFRRSSNAEESLAKLKAHVHLMQTKSNNTLNAEKSELLELEQKYKEKDRQLAEYKVNLQSAERQVDKLQQQLQIRSELLSSTEKEMERERTKMKQKHSRDRNEAARERKLRRDSLAMGSIYHTHDHEDHILELSQKVSVLEARERHALGEVSKYKKISEDLKYEVIRLGGEIHHMEDELEHEKSEHHPDNRATALRIMESKVRHQQDKINDLKEKLSCAEVLTDTSKVSEPSALPNNTISEIQERLTVQNKKLLDKVDRLQTKNAEVSSICSVLCYVILFYSILFYRMCFFL
jgi:hypothetical protein